jgi:branched-subunit amino acid transport protein
MDAWWTILAMAIAVYAVRLSGLLLAEVTIPSGWERALAFVPVATLTALVVGGLGSGAGWGVVEGMALVGAGVVAWRSGRGWTAIPAGLAIYGLLRLAGA